MEEHVTYERSKKNAYKNLVGKPKLGKPRRRPGRISKSNISAC